MTDYFILNDGDPFLIAKADDKGVVTGFEKMPGDEWEYDHAVEMQKSEGEMSLAQAVAIFGRYAGYMPVEKYRRVQPRGESVIKDEDSEIDLRAEGDIVKTDPDKRIVFGWAYVMQKADGTEVIDKSGDFLDEVEELEKSAYDYVLKSRQSDADHTNVKGGEMVESIVFTPEKIEKMGLPAGSIPLGWWVGYKINDEPTWERVKKGELRAFSIHGSGTRTKVAP